MELKNITEDHDNVDLEVALAEPLVVGNDGALEKSDGLNTPTKELKRIQPMLTCPPAPRKPKAAPLKKRKGSSNLELRLLDFSKDVLALYPPALLQDFGNKVKKAKIDYYYYEQLKENISTNLNCKYTS